MYVTVAVHGSTSPRWFAYQRTRFVFSSSTGGRAGVDTPVGGRAGAVANGLKRSWSSGALTALVPPPPPLLQLAWAAAGCELSSCACAVHEELDTDEA